ncbi:hypothetical protein [Stenotrophomonas maltophilia]|uniref:hypothetical protein n=1 Tax=Stenotrophomonas maltophilia TaxID=40324 RepID=UPI0015F20145|nr:hypothetical protein [Stenotrophomonas maltophilia]QDY49821.1 hypothetical protein DUW70_15405 [Stenotrophomonas maltophilia]
MREHPILFNGAMVRAILAGEKTQTRRLCKDMNAWVDQSCREVRHVDGLPHHFLLGAQAPIEKLRCPLGEPGDRLWVRETTVNVEKHGYRGPVHLESEEGYATLQGGLAPGPDDVIDVEPHEITLRPSIHMPRAMCRLFLEITDVRVERLQAISEADAVAEGATAAVLQEIRLRHGHPRAAQPMVYEDSREIFADLWDSTGGDWNSNPWVWVITFKRIEA